MKSNVLFWLFIAIVGLPFLYSCSREAERDESPIDHPSAAFTQLSPPDAMLKHRLEISDKLSLLAQGLASVLPDPDLVRATHSYAGFTYQGTDLWAMLAAVDAEYLKLTGSTLQSKMIASLQSQGLQQQDLIRIPSLFGTWQYEGHLLEPFIFCPFLDQGDPILGTVAQTGNAPTQVAVWDYFTPGTCVAFKPASPSLPSRHSLGHTQLSTSPGWVVGIGLKRNGGLEDIVVMGPKALERCKCFPGAAQGGYFCAPGSEWSPPVTAAGNCGRYLPVLGIDCTGQCDGNGNL